MATLLLLNGGLGRRIGAEIPKQFIRVKSIPLFIYSLRIACNIDEIDEIVVNYPEGWLDKLQDLITKYAIQKSIKFVPAGETRQESVRRMLDVCTGETVILHEAARPLVTEEEFIKLIQHPVENITYALPVPFTVLETDEEKKYINKTLNRDLLVNIQLPQKFVAAHLKEAHIAAYKNGKNYTEDASLVFDNGNSVQAIQGSERNIKVTTPLDIHIAEFLLDESGGLLDV